MSQCEKCLTDRSLCDSCRLNPKYADYPTRSLFRAYNPTCPIGRNDCVYDPAYVKCYHPAWYEQMYGDMAPEAAAKMNCTPDEDGHCSDYDCEDK